MSLTLKSMPTVAWDEGKSYMIAFFELIVGVALNDGGFSNSLVTEEYNSELLGIAVAMGGSYAHIKVVICSIYQILIF